MGKNRQEGEIVKSFFPTRIICERQSGKMGEKNGENRKCRTPNTLLLGNELLKVQSRHSGSKGQGEGERERRGRRARNGGMESERRAGGGGHTQAQGKPGGGGGARNLAERCKKKRNVVEFWECNQCLLIIVWRLKNVEK